MGNPETGIINANYVSAWGGIQSAGQTIGQIVRSTVLTVYLMYMLTIYLALSSCSMQPSQSDANQPC